MIVETVNHKIQDMGCAKDFLPSSSSIKAESDNQRRKEGIHGGGKKYL